MANLTNSAKLIEEVEKKVNSSSLATVATSGSYADLSNKPTIPTVNDSTITVQKNGANVGSFTTNAAAGKTINIQLAKADVGLGNVDNTSDANKPISTATQTALNNKQNKLTPGTGITIDASNKISTTALPGTTKYGASLDLSIDDTTFVITAQLKDQDGNNLGTSKTIDLPLESVVVSGSYDSATKKVILALKDGSTVDFSVADLISGLQSEITSTNKLGADLVDDTNSTHKFVTSTEKSTWNGKQDAIQDLATIRLNADAGANAASTIANYGDIVSHNADEFAAATHTHQISDVSGLQTALNGKAPSTHTHAISDVTGLQDALNGKANSSHTHTIADVTGLSDALDDKANASDLSTLENTVSDLSDEVDGKQDTLESGTNIKSVNGNSLLGSGNLVLHSSISVTLTAAGWSNEEQSVTAAGVTASNSVITSPAPANITDYADALIYCSAQASNSLTFKCTTAPESDIVVNVLILN